MRLRPHHVLFTPGILILMLSFFLNDETTDIHVHDTYYIVGLTEYYIVLAFLLLFVGLLYWMFRKFFYSRLLMWVHVAIHVISVLLAAILPVFVRSFTEIHNYRSSDVDMRYVSLVFVLWLLSQAIFLYHVVSGYLRWRKL